MKQFQYTICKECGKILVDAKGISLATAVFPPTAFYIERRGSYTSGQWYSTETDHLYVIWAYCEPCYETESKLSYL